MQIVKITYFVHGTTTDNEHDRGTGWNPGTLSKLGITQAKDLANHISIEDFDVVFCSDLKRAIDSANLCFENNVQIIQDARLRECNYGDLNGQSFEQEIKKTDHIEKPFPNGEAYKDVEKRIEEFLRFLADAHPGQHIAIVAHQAPQLALEVLLQGKTWEQAFEEDWRNTKSWQPGWEFTFDPNQLPSLSENLVKPAKNQHTL